MASSIIKEPNTISSISGSTNYGGQYVAYKVGKVVHLFVYNITDSETGHDIIIMTLPEGYRPRRTCRAIMIARSANLNLTDNAVFVNIGTTGNVVTYTYTTFNNAAFDITYICA